MIRTTTLLTMSPIFDLIHLEKISDVNYKTNTKRDHLNESILWFVGYYFRISGSFEDGGVFSVVGFAF